MKKVLILHGYESNSKEHWFLEFKKKLEENNFKAFVPDLPNSFHPKQKEWLNYITQNYPVDEEWILVGHSLGGTLILRFLESYHKKISKAVLIATPIEDIGYEDIKDFFKIPFNWNKIKQNCNEFIIINSAKDEDVPVSHGKLLSKRVDGKFYLEKRYDHNFDDIDLDFLFRLSCKNY